MKFWLIAAACIVSWHAAAADLGCTAPPAIAPVTANAKLSVTVNPKPDGTPADGVIDPQSAWQPRGGTVAFTLRGNGATLDDSVKIDVCFGWSDQSYQRSPRVWVTRLDTNAITYNAIVPRLEPAKSDVPRTGFGIVPVANMRVLVTGGSAGTGVEVIHPVGITQPVVAAGIAVVSIAVGILVLGIFAHLRGVPGRGLVLWLISTRNGVASLSQAQVVLWTFVIGASAMYVMALSGGLIEISNGTLILLGISGVAILGSKLQNNQADTKDTSSTAARVPPGPVSNLQQVGDAADTEIRLAWSPPTTGGLTKAYSVQYRIALAAGSAAGTPQNPWVAVAETITRPHHTVLGLLPGRSYDFRVRALDTTGTPGDEAITPTPIKTSVSPVVAGVPGPATGLRLERTMLNEILVAWSAVPGAISYGLQFRPHDSVAPWANWLETAGTSGSLQRLQPGVSYDIRVVALNAAGQSVPSYVLTSATTRNPQWNDLVVTGDGRGEVDVTRVQMLFFTVITAIFVTMTVLNSYTIPEIPPGFLILMGISNGLYVGNKFIPG